jgi:MFS family permease
LGSAIGGDGDRRLASTEIWRCSGLAFYAYFAFGTLFQLFPPLFDAIMEDFGVSRPAVSLTMAVFMAPLLLLAVPAGLAADRYPAGPLVRAGLLLMGLGAAVSAAAASFPQLLLGRAVAGAGASLLVASTLKVVAERVPRDRLGLVLGIFAAGLPAGTGVAFNALSLLGRSFGWRATALAGVAVVATVWPVLRWAPSGPPGSAREGSLEPGAGRSPSSDGRAWLRGHAELWRLALVTVLAYTAIIGFTTWTPTALVGAAALPVWLSAALASLLLVIDIPFAPLWGRVSDRLGRRKRFIVAAFAVYLGGSLVVPRIALVPDLAVPGLLAVIAVMGIGCSMFFPAALAIPAEILPPERAGMAYGVLFGAQVAGMLAGPAVVALALDRGGTSAGFLTISVLTLAGLVLSLTLKTR